MKRLKDSSDVPEARLGILPKTCTSSKKKSEERDFVVDSGSSMHMISKRDLNSAELETMRTSGSPTTVMTADGEVQTREEATVHVKQLDLFVQVMLLEESPAVLSFEKFCEDHGYTYHWISGRNNISSEMARGLIAIYPTMCHLWFLVYQRFLPQLHLHQLLHHLHHRIPYLMSAHTPKLQYRKEVEVRVRSYGETRCMKPTETENKNKNEGRGEVQSDLLHDLPDWLQDFREFGR